MGKGLLVLSGLILIYLEFFFPSWVLGFLALIALIGASFLFEVWWAFFPIFAAAGAVSLIALYQVRHRIALTENQEGFVAASFDKNLIGKKGIVSTDLKPSGYIEIGQDRIQAVSERGYIVKGSLIEVIGGEGANLIVKHTKE